MNAPSTTAAASPLIDAPTLRERLASGEPVMLIDASFDLARPTAGRQSWLEARLPGARHADLDHDLSTTRTGRNGRHPLPTRAAFARTVGAWGLQPGQAAVVYDRSGGMFAARAWWMMRWLGHRAVQLLDGGFPAWVAAGGAVEAGEPADAATPSGAAPYPLSAEPAMAVWTADEVQAALGRITVIDARAPERFRGDVEPLDAVAGHIPGALNRPFNANLGADGRFLSPADLQAAFAPLVQGGRTVVQQCGSGVTACHNLLAMSVAGLGESAVYAGSWSEWSSDPARPVARG